MLYHSPAVRRFRTVDYLSIEPRVGVKLLVACCSRSLPTIAACFNLEIVGLTPVRTCQYSAPYSTPYSAPVPSFQWESCPPESFDRRVRFALLVRFTLLVFSRFLFVVEYLSSVVLGAIGAIRVVIGIYPSQYLGYGISPVHRDGPYFMGYMGTCLREVILCPCVEKELEVGGSAESRLVNKGWGHGEECAGLDQARAKKHDMCGKHPPLTPHITVQSSISNLVITNGHEVVKSEYCQHVVDSIDGLVDAAKWPC